MNFNYVLLSEINLLFRLPFVEGFDGRTPDFGKPHFAKVDSVKPLRWRLKIGLPTNIPNFPPSPCPLFPRALCHFTSLALSLSYLLLGDRHRTPSTFGVAFTESVTRESRRASTLILRV